MKRVLSLSIAVLLCASQAAALSCMRPDVTRTFQWASDADERYVVFLGEFSFDAPPARGLDVNNPVDISVPARFVGSYLGADGFVDGAALDMTLNFTCAGPWCGSLGEDQGRVLAFVQETPEGYVLDVEPCNGTIFSEPLEHRTALVEACMRGEPCRPRPQTR